MQLVTTQQAKDALDMLDAYADGVTDADHRQNADAHSDMQKRLKTLAKAFDRPLLYSLAAKDINTTTLQAMAGQQVCLETLNGDFEGVLKHVDGTRWQVCTRKFNAGDVLYATPHIGCICLDALKTQ